MKKILLIISVFLLTANVRALELWEIQDMKEACPISTIEQGRKDLEMTTYNLEYLPDMVDRDENKLTGYMKFTLSSMPSTYEAVIKTQTGGTYEFSDSNLTTALPGGVYTITYYNKSCTTPIKVINFRIPFYRTYCVLDKNCDDNPWFDGTYENTASNQNATKKTKLNIVLVVILVILLLIIAGFTFVIIKRRKDYAKSL